MMFDQIDHIKHFPSLDQIESFEVCFSIINLKQQKLGIRKNTLFYVWTFRIKYKETIT